MSKKPFISIAIASYNYGKYLERGFEAIKNQNVEDESEKYFDMEIVYLDDASTDDSIEIIEHIISTNSNMNIRLVKNVKNEGILRTKTRLINECQGTYIMFCDADDWMAEDCLLKLAKAAKAENADRVISQVYDIDEKGKILQIQDFPKKPSKWLWNIHHGCLYKRSILVDNNIEILYEPDDVYMITRFNQYAEKISWIYEPLYYWFVHKDSAGRKNIGEEAIEKAKQDFLNVINYVDDAAKNMKLNGKESKQILELLIIKIYYLQIFHVSRYFSVKQKLQCQHELQKLIKSKHPGYLHNDFLYRGESPMRRYATGIIRLSAFLERLHLMKIGLIGYHMLGKIIYLDQ